MADLSAAETTAVPMTEAPAQAAAAPAVVKPEGQCRAGWHTHDSSQLD
jgi:hypothetical protein